MYLINNKKKIKKILYIHQSWLQKFGIIFLYSLILLVMLDRIIYD